jgi:hypothetical protein
MVSRTKACQGTKEAGRDALYWYGEGYAQSVDGIGSGGSTRLHADN